MPAGRGKTCAKNTSGGGWHCGGIPRLHPRRPQTTVHFGGLGHQPERYLSAALQPRPRPGAPTQHPNVSAATPGPMTLSCRARSTAPRHRPTQRALCHAPGAHLGRHTTVCPKLKVWDQTMKNTGASPARVPFGQPKKRGKSMPGGERRTVQAGPPQGFCCRPCPLAGPSSTPVPTLRRPARHERPIRAAVSGPCLARARRGSVVCT